MTLLVLCLASSLAISGIENRAVTLQGRDLGARASASRVLLAPAAAATFDAQDPGLEDSGAQVRSGQDLFRRLVVAAHERTNYEVRYDGSYRCIPYPGGDVPGDVGVCTDLIIRAYRAVGIDLQRVVHEDMKASFHEYPAIWGLERPDPNIDHRRVLNLETFFERRGASLAATNDPADYRPGDLVSWRLPGNLPHIGIVSTTLAEGTNRHRIVHNIGEGPKVEDVLFAYPVAGHFRYPPSPD